MSSATGCKTVSIHAPRTVCGAGGARDRGAPAASTGQPDAMTVPTPTA